MFHELTLPGAASSVPLARRFVQTALTGLGQDELVWTAALLVSELVTNAALHARTDITVVVAAVAAGPVRLEVRDGSARLPRGRSYGTGATTGRGLQLVADLSARWGVDPQAAGKTVWVELDRPGTGSEQDAWAVADALHDGVATDRAVLPTAATATTDPPVAGCVRAAGRSAGPGTRARCAAA